MAIYEWLRCAGSCQKSSLQVDQRTFRRFMPIGVLGDCGKGVRVYEAWMPVARIRGQSRGSG